MIPFEFAKIIIQISLGWDDVDTNDSFLSNIRETIYLRISLFGVLITISILGDKTHHKFVLITNNKFKKSKVFFVHGEKIVSILNDPNASINNNNINNDNIYYWQSHFEYLQIRK